VIGLLLAGLLLVGTSPFGVGGVEGDSRGVAFAMIAVNVGFALVTFLKGELTLGLVAIFVPLVGLVAASRLAKPRSLWARRFYSEAKTERARARFAAASRLARWHNRFDDLIGGAPTFGVMMPLRMGLSDDRLRAGD
jgi:hypothetical protein